MTSLQITEGPVATSRLTLFILRSRPEMPEGRVLLLGGSNFDLRLKRQFLSTTLARRFEVVTYEPRGIGRTTQPDGARQIGDYALDAVALLDALGWSSADVVGESFGGMTALHLALAAPDRVGRIAIASATSGGAAGTSFDISRFLNLPVADAATLALRVQDIANDDLHTSDPAAFQRPLDERMAFDAAFARPSVESGGYARLLAARARHDVWDELAGIPHDAVVITGTHDRQAPPEAQRAVAERLPDALYWEYDADHGATFVSPMAMDDLCAHWFGKRIVAQDGKGNIHG